MSISRKTYCQPLSGLTLPKRNRSRTGFAPAGFALGLVAALFSPMAVLATPANNGCPAGTYYPSNSAPVFPDVCIPASPGTFVNSVGATSAILASPGTFVSSAGATSAQFAPAGYFVASAGQSAATIAPPGTFVSSAGASAPSLAPPGRFVSTAGATTTQIAPAGFFVASAGQSAPTPAPLGQFVSSPGQTQATNAPPGFFVGATGQSSASAAPLGFYVANAGQSAATLAPVGTFVGVVGATAPSLAPPGTYVDQLGQSAPTLAPPGTYVNSAGATAANLAAPGTYVPVAGATSAFTAPLGTFVSFAGATAPQSAPPGTFVDVAGATAPILAPVGKFTNTYGSALAADCPVNTVSYGGSVACRGAVPNGIDTVAPVFASTYGTGGVINLGAISQGVVVNSIFDIWNSANLLGFADPLTDLTILQVAYYGADAALFTLTGFVPGTVLHEGQLKNLFATYNATGSGPIDVNFVIYTDQGSPLGEYGEKFAFSLAGRVLADNQNVPEPGALSLMGLALAALAGFTALGRKKRKPQVGGRSSSIASP